MADGDLCTPEDVLNEGNITPDMQTDYMLSSIQYKITDLSSYIKSADVTNNPTLQPYDPTQPIQQQQNEYNATKACTFGVLQWLESHKLIRMTEKLVLQKEGDTEQRFSENSNSYPSYTDLYNYFINKLIGNPPVGARVRRPYGYGYYD